MGDRAVVVFTNGHHTSPAVYLHWSGCDVPDILAKLKELMQGRGDLDYVCARFIGLAHDALPGNLSLGVFNSDPEETPDSPGDAGGFHVDIRNWSVVVYGARYKPDYKGVTSQDDLYMFDV